MSLSRSSVFINVELGFVFFFLIERTRQIKQTTQRRAPTPAAMPTMASKGSKKVWLFESGLDCKLSVEFEFELKDCGVDDADVDDEDDNDASEEEEEENKEVGVVKVVIVVVVVVVFTVGAQFGQRNGEQQPCGQLEKQLVSCKSG